jgi:superfamily II DNA/RNA helicase
VCADAFSGRLRPPRPFSPGEREVVAEATRRRRRVPQRGTALTSSDTTNRTSSPTATAQSLDPPNGVITGPDPASTATADRPSAATFAELGVRPETCTALAAVGIATPFAIQALTLPIAMAGADVIGQARTGTGKTLAFGIPILQRMTVPGSGTPQALIVVPTRELCVQVAKDLAMAGSTRSVRVLAIYGGRSYEPQVDALRTGVDIVVGTPGRLLDLIQQGRLNLAEVSVVVLDEADEMLDLGFLPDVERILARTPEDRQTLLFSATMPGAIVTLARRFMLQPTHITAEMPDEGRTVPTTSQHVFRAHALDKAEMLARILQAEGRGLTMVFCRTKRTADKVALDLDERGFAAAAVHGDLGQGQREQALRAFRSGKVDVLVATDVAARGIDVTGVTHVINYQCPEDEKVYLHRIGRTGRAGGSGIAVTFVDWDDVPRWTLINTALALPFPDLVETYSSSPHLYESLDIPRSATGRLPRSQRVRAGLDAERVEDLGETGRRRRSGGVAVVTGKLRDRGEGRSRAGAGADDAPTDRSDPGIRRPGRRRRTRGGGAARGAGVSQPVAPTGAVVASAGAEAATGSAANAGRGPSRARGASGDLAVDVGIDHAVDLAVDGSPTRRRRRRGGRGRGRASGEAGAETA